MNDDTPSRTFPPYNPPDAEAASGRRVTRRPGTPREDVGRHRKAPEAASQLAAATGLVHDMAGQGGS
jgi:hypothetical protein